MSIGTSQSFFRGPNGVFTKTLQKIAHCNDLEVTEKECKQCGKVQSLDEFHSQPGGKYGKKAICKTCCHGEKGQHKKWSSEEVVRIRAMRQAGLSIEKIAEEFNVDKSKLRNIIEHKNYCKIYPSDQDVKDIRKEFNL